MDLKYSQVPPIQHENSHSVGIDHFQGDDLVEETRMGWNPGFLSGNLGP